MSPDEKKRAVARAALAHLKPGVVLGVGTGSTANYFIEALAAIKSRIEVTVASSFAERGASRASRYPCQGSE